MNGNEGKHLERKPYSTAVSALMRYKVESWNSCSAGILPARYVPHNTGKCCNKPLLLPPDSV